MNRTNVILAVLAFVALALCLLISPRLARAHDHYNSWKQPDNGASCCNDTDCRPTHARMTDAETWEAWNGERWVAIPPHKVLKMQSPDGRSHLCEDRGTVYCFLPAGPKS